MRLILLSFLVLSFLRGAGIEITGQQKEYAGKKIRFFRYSDPVAREKEEMFVLEVDAAGNFTASPAVKTNTYVFSEFGIYRGNLILEPGRNIELLLPPLREKTFAERKNPYFSPVEFWFATREGNHLNDKIMEFDNKLNQLTDKFFNQLYFQQSKNAFDSVQTSLSKEFAADPPEAFGLHRRLRLKAVEADAFRLQPAKIAPALTEVKSGYWNFPAFTELFEKTFAGKLSFEAKSMQGDAVHRAVAKNDLAFLKNLVNTRYGVSGTLSDLVLIKLLHDGFYSGDFSQEHILQLLNSKSLVAHQNPSIRETALNVVQKLTHLRVGTTAPVICLNDINGVKRCTNDNGDKFRYIIFADTEMIVLREQLKYLTKIEELFGKHLSIYVVLLKTDLIEMKKFLVEEKIPGVHLVDAGGEYQEKYRVKTFPSCYLLNSSHEIVFEDTKAPLDGFEQQFGTFLRQYLFRQQRGQ